MSSIIDSTSVSRVSAKNDDHFHECIKVSFNDETGVYRSLVNTESRLDLRLYKLDNGNALRIEICSPDHDSLVFRRDLNERLFKDDQYFVKQELTFDFKSIYQIIVDFVRSMPGNKSSFIRCVVRKISSSKCSCELGLVAAALTSKPAFKIQLDPLSGSQLIEYLEKINDSTKKNFNRLLEKYRRLKTVQIQVDEMIKQIDDFKAKEQKHWTEKTLHQKREMALLGISSENAQLKEAIDNLKAETESLRQVLEHEKLDNDRLYKQCCQLEEDYEDRLAELHNDHGSLIKSINEAHVKTQRERDNLRKERDRLQAEIERLQRANNLPSSAAAKDQTQSFIQSSRAQQKQF